MDIHRNNQKPAMCSMRIAYHSLLEVSLDLQALGLSLTSAFDVKFVPPSENCSPLLMCQSRYVSAGDCCLVTSVSYATQLSLFIIKFFRFNVKFSSVKLMSKVLF